MGLLLVLIGLGLAIVGAAIAVVRGVHATLKARKEPDNEELALKEQNAVAFGARLIVLTALIGIVLIIAGLASVATAAIIG